MTPQAKDLHGFFIRAFTTGKSLGIRLTNKAEFYIRRGDKKRLRRLLNKRPQLLRPGDTYLLFVAIWSQPTLIPWLLERGVATDHLPGFEMNTPLMHAAANGEVWLLDLLLNNGAEIEAVNESNERALGFATTWRQPSAARLLLERGADPNALEDPDKTYLDWAIICEYFEIADLLRSFGALEFSELTNRVV